MSKLSKKRLSIQNNSKIKNISYFNDYSSCNAVIETSDGFKLCIDMLYLSQYSDFFKCAFYGQNKEYLERKRHEIYLPTISYEQLLTILNFLKFLIISKQKEKLKCNNKLKLINTYCQDKIKNKEIQLSTALDMLDTAAYLQIELVLIKLSDIISQKVTTSTLLVTYRKAEKRYLPLAQRLWRIIVEDFKVLVKAGNFLELTATQMIALLKEPKLNLDPSDEYFVVSKWLKTNEMNYDAKEINQLGFAIAKTQFLSLETATTSADKSNNFLINMSQNNTNLLNTGGIGFYDRPRIPQSLLLSVGGWATGGPTNQLEFYEPNRQKWLLVQPNSQISCNERRAYHALIYISSKINNLSSTIYLMGGYDGLRHHKSMHKFDLNDMTWSEIAPMNEQRCYVSGSMIDFNHIIAIGGFNEDSRLKSAEILDIEKNQWSVITPMNLVRSDADCVNIDGRIYAVGGFNGSLCHNSCEVYDPVLNSWILLTRPMRYKRSGAKAACVAEKVLVVVGGFTGTMRLRTPEFYDPREGIWHLLADMSNKRSNFGFQTLNSELVVCGGYNTVSTINMCESFDWRANAWTRLPDMSFSKSALALCRIDRHRFIEQIVNEYDNKDFLPL